MAYEYERYIKNLISVESIFEHEVEERIDRELEIKEVYAKAKAFDEIKKLRNSYYTYSKRDNGGLVALLDAKPFGREVSHFINKKEYMEDK